MSFSTPTKIPAVAPPEFRQKHRRTRDLTNEDGRKNAHKPTDDQFEHFVALIADGVSIADGMATTKITRFGLDATLRANDSARARYEEAKITALWRDISLEVLESMMADIATGKFVNAVCEDHCIAQNRFYSLVLKDPVAKEMYDEARQVCMETWADEIVEISDDSLGDWTEDKNGNLRVNNEVVQRSRLRVETRKWTMGKLNYKRYGDRIQQDIEANVTIDYASRLESARKRKAAARLDTD